MIEAIERQVTSFEMPGVGIPQFRRHAAAMRPLASTTWRSTTTTCWNRR